MSGAAGAETRAALYLDFDNVFAALAAWDEWAAWRFAAEPQRWIAWLAAGADRGGPARRLLVRRCYLNPAGWTEPEPGGGLAQWLGQPRLYYSRFRAEFVRAGFQVVDCPRLARLKNGADILMALDIADALAHPARYEEVIILSGDSDFTPLLHRLRAHDRRTLLVAQPASAQALRAAADAVIALDAFAEAATEEAAACAATPARPAAAATRAEAAAPRPPPLPAGDPLPDPGEPAAQREAILSALRRILAASPQPLHLPGLGKRVHEALGGWVRRGRFGGAGTLAKLIEESGDLPLEAGPGGGWLYDPARHERPSLAQPDLAGDALATTPDTALGPLRDALGAGHAPPGLAPPWLAAEALDFALRGLAALLPLPGPPDAAQRAALAAEAAGAGLDLPPRELDALVAWLTRARLDWRAEPGEAPRDRLARALFAELTRQVAAGGTRLAPEETAAVREWVGLTARLGERPPPPPVAKPAPAADTSDVLEPHQEHAATAAPDLEDPARPAPAAAGPDDASPPRVTPTDMDRPAGPADLPGASQTWSNIRSDGII